MSERAKTIYNEKKKIWHGIKIEKSYGPECSLGALIYNSLKERPESIAQISYSSGKQLTNGEILLLSKRVAQHLEDLKLEQGDIVGICAVNSDYLACLVFGCLFRGLVISTLDPTFDKDGIKHIYGITKPKLMFCDAAIYENIKKAFEECELNDTKIYTMDDYKEDVPKLVEFLKETQREEDFKCVTLKEGPNQLAFILCSSGTTGLPKGVCLTHLGFLHQISGLPFDSEERALCFSTLYWISGVMVLLIGTVQKYTRIITSKAYNPEDFIKILRKYKATFFLGPPSQIGLLLSCPKLQQNDLASFKAVYLGGSPVPYSLVQKLQTYIPKAKVSIAYGQTELCAGVSVGSVKEEGNCGHLVPNMEVKIIDNDNRNLGPNEVGEICSRAVYDWPGYYGNPEATAIIYDKDKWIHSGDLGYFNDKGDLYVVDRKKDILKYNNYHFYPTEIEGVISKLKDVVEVCVFGIPDIIYTHLPAAAIVKKPNSKLCAEDVLQLVQQEMAHFKQLRGGVYFVDELPKTPSGKILRRIVAESFKDYKTKL
ncbi:uncharacterized protein ACRADG_008411 isoform 2-T4 [Cochliomyia hominivorax]